MCTGALAGHNAVRDGIMQAALTLPSDTAIGDLIAFTNEMMKTTEGRRNRYTFAGAEYFERMKERGLYSIDKEEIKVRIQRLGLLGVFKENILD